MTEKKMTTKEFYSKVIDGDISAEVIKFAQTALDKANARSAKTSGKRTEENQAVIEKIKTVLTSEPQGAGEVTEALNHEFTTQKISYCLGAMAKNGDCTMTPIKIKGRKVNGYSIAEVVEEVDEIEE